MIKKLHVQNFQSHKNSTLEFSPGVNIIVGSSDSGKSTIIRALKWLVWNRPLGDSFRSHWGGKTVVSVHLEENDIIVRSKDKQEEYWLNDQQFLAFRTEVPDEVKRILNIDEINLQQQLDSPFLLTLSPGEVAQKFNKIAHLDQIDEGLSFIRKEIREVNGELKYTKSELDSLREELKQYDFVKQMEADLEVIDQQYKEVTSLDKTIRELTSITLTIDEVQHQIKETKELLKLEGRVNSLISLYDEIESVERNNEMLSETITEIKSVKSLISKTSYIIDLTPKVDQSIQLIKKVDQSQKNMGNLEKILGDIKYTKSKIREMLKSYKDLEEKFHEEMGDTCPLCGQPIKHLKI